MCVIKNGLYNKTLSCHDGFTCQSSSRVYIRCVMDPRALVSTAAWTWWTPRSLAEAWSLDWPSTPSGASGWLCRATPPNWRVVHRFTWLQLILLQMACCICSLHVSIGSFPPTLQVDPSVFDANPKDLRGLAWLLARHKLSLNHRHDGSILDGQRKRQKNVGRASPP